VKSTVETLSPTRVRLNVEVTFDEIKPSIDAAYKNIASQVNIPGFRRGKIPARIIDQRVGRSAVLDEVVNEVLPRAYSDALRENNVYAIGRPEIEVTEVADGDHVAFTAEVDTRPEFDLPELSTITVQVDGGDMSPEAVERQLDSLRGRFAKLSPVERAAIDGDVLQLDIVGTVDGESADEYTASSLAYTLGSEGLVPGADAKLAGTKADDITLLTFTPEDGPHEGKNVALTITTTSIRERVLPAADDDFAQLASEFDTIEELRDDIRVQLGQMGVLGIANEARDKALRQLVEGLDVAVPENTVAAEIASHFQDGHGDDDHRLAVRDEIVESMKAQFVLDKLADQFEVSVSEADLSNWVVQNAPQYNMTPQALLDALVQSGDLSVALSDVRRGKALAELVDSVKVVDASGAVVDIKALLAGAVGAAENSDEDVAEDLAE
jgi:trigger factor